MVGLTLEFIRILINQTRVSHVGLFAWDVTLSLHKRGLLKGSVLKYRIFSHFPSKTLAIVNSWVHWKFYMNTILAHIMWY